MESLPNQLNGIRLEFSSGTANKITDDMLEGLAAFLKPDVVSGCMLTAL